MCGSQFGHTATPRLLPRHKRHQSPLQDVQWTPKVIMDIIKWMYCITVDIWCWCTINNNKWYLIFQWKRPPTSVFPTTRPFSLSMFVGPALWRIAPQRPVPFSGASGRGRSAPPPVDATVSSRARWPARTGEAERPRANITACGSLALPAGSDVTFCPVAEVRKSSADGKMETSGYLIMITSWF